MTLTELESAWRTARRIAQRERNMRQAVFRNKPALQVAKLEEMDTLLTILDRLKDELKPHCTQEPTQQQPLFDYTDPHTYRQ